MPPTRNDSSLTVFPAPSISRDLTSGLALLRMTPASKGRFDYLSLDLEGAGKSAETGAEGEMTPALNKVA
jgi:NTE family protein